MKDLELIKESNKTKPLRHLAEDLRNFGDMLALGEITREQHDIAFELVLEELQSRVSVVINK